MAGAIVRAATSKDRDTCLHLIATLTKSAVAPGWSAAFDALLQGARGAVLVATDGERILGVVTVSYNLAIRYAGEYCLLEELIVDPASRGQNVGGALVEAAIAAARKHGCAEIGLYLLDRTEGNRPFYEKYGFRHVGREMRQSL